mmetsp:Transcript_16771/g.27689  ORF Transcript_16771/g.27689 Transcript_16771/m.27689 type:complete len:328 (-) Transcript_16771:25-1008(-)
MSPCCDEEYDQTHWVSFADVAGDEVLLLIFGYLDAGSVLSFVQSAASVTARLATDCDAERGSVVHRLALSYFGCNEIATAAEMVYEATADALGGGGRSAAWSSVALLHVFASEAAAVEVLRRAVSLTTATELKGRAYRDARPLLDALFWSECQCQWRRQRCSMPVTNAAEVAFKALLRKDSDAAIIAASAAEAILAAERHVDGLIDNGLCMSHSGGYELVARRRSAVEFLRKRLDEGGGVSHVAAKIAAAGSAPSAVRDVQMLVEARRDLELATASLDCTVADYTREGYELLCPQLLGPQWSVPHSHWWVFRSPAHSQGWAVLNLFR